jgi:RNA polymerase sigma-70 factor (sigma-E family)
VLLTGDWHTAEDLVQTCLVKLYRVWHRLDTGVDPDSYLRRTLINTYRSWRRARWRREAPVEAIPDRAIEVDDQDRHALAETVRQALGALPARQRAALVLRFYEDLPEAQVADLLGCSVGSVKTHTSRGIRRLRELLGDELVPLTRSGAVSTEWPASGVPADGNGSQPSEEPMRSEVELP